jgi:hypothetical protein
MADNLLNGLSLTVIAQEALPVLQAKLAPLGLFTTDFSSEVATVGSAVSTRIATAMTAQDYSRATGYVANTVSSSAITVTLNKHKYFVAGFDDSEVGNIGLSKLEQTFIQPMANAIGNAMQNDLLALITTAYPQAYSASYASFGFAGITAVAKVLDNSGSNAPRGVLLGTNVFYDVLDDIKGVYSVGADALRKGTVGELAGMQVAQVPSAIFGGLASSQAAGLAGFMAGQDALVIAARLPGIPSGNVETANLTLPNGFTVQLRKWYSPDEGMWKLGAVAIYGVSRGNVSSGVRILTTD